MPFKTITIKESIYNDLARAKPASESFGEFFERLLKRETKKDDIMKFAGAWKISKSEGDAILTKIYERRESADADFRRRATR